jgi:ABC-type Fe3+/spermidine/putrescine transport system ATPase subunit
LVSHDSEQVAMNYDVHKVMNDDNILQSETPEEESARK